MKRDRDMFVFWTAFGVMAVLVLAAVLAVMDPR